MSTVQAIDFEKMMKDEKTKASKPFIFKQASREDLFNMLQDQRHIVVIDLRPKNVHYAFHIRNSYCIDEAEGNENQLFSFLELVEKKYKADEEKYNTKPIRRLIMIDTNQNVYNENNEKIKFVLECIRKYSGLDKVFYLKQGIEHFAEKYSFICINLNERDQEKANKQTEENKNNDQQILSEFEKKWFYSLSRFPTELIENKLYLGSVHNANNTKQLQDLKIKAIVEFISYKDQPIPEQKTANYVYKNIPIDNETIYFVNFDDICTYIDELLSDTNKYPVLLCCKDGDTFSPGFAMAYLIWHKKLSLTLASVTVYQRRGTVDVNKTLYTILSTWQPKGVENKGTLPSWFAK